MVATNAGVNRDHVTFGRSFQPWKGAPTEGVWGGTFWVFPSTIHWPPYWIDPMSHHGRWGGGGQRGLLHPTSHPTSRPRQWDLVCSSRGLKQLAQSIYMAGVLVGGIVFGGLSDR